MKIIMKFYKTLEIEDIKNMYVILIYKCIKQLKHETGHIDFDINDPSDECIQFLASGFLLHENFVYIED